MGNHETNKASVELKGSGSSVAPDTSIDQKGVAADAAAAKSTNKVGGRLADSTVDGETPKRSGSLAKVIQAILAMSDSQLNQILVSIDDTIEKVSEESVDIGGILTEENGFTPEISEKAKTLFEAAVSQRIVAKTQEISEAMVAAAEGLRDQLNEEYEAAGKALAEQYENEIQQLSEQANHYLDYVAKEFVEQNQIAIEDNLKQQVAEELINDLRDVLLKHNISIPTDQISVVEEQAKVIDEYERKLDEELNRSIALEEELEAFKKAAILAEQTDLTVTQMEKLKALTEEIEYTDDDSFRRHVSIITESHFAGTAPEPKQNAVKGEVESVMLSEEEQIPTTPTSTGDPAIDKTVEILNRMTAKKI